MLRRAAHLTLTVGLTLIATLVLVVLLASPNEAGAAPSAQATATAVPPTPGPAPKTDRVGFPEGYDKNYKQFYVFDREDNKQVRAVFANDKAASVKDGQPYPYGSILVMETWRTKQDAAGNILKDANGRYQRDALTGIFVMRKEPGFGVDYDKQRTGEWEYVAFRPDKTYSSPPDRTNACAACHLQTSDTGKDWVVRANLFFQSVARPSALPTTGHDLPMDEGLNLAALGVMLLIAGLAFSLRRRQA